MIRRLDGHDVTALCRLEQICFPSEEGWSMKDFQQEMANPQAVYWGWFNENNQLAGMIGLWDLTDRMEIVNVAVDPDYRRKGIARQLLDTAMTWMNSKNVKNCTLEVRQSNTVAIRLYEQYGFEIWARKRDYYASNHEDAWLMGKGVKE